MKLVNFTGEIKLTDIKDIELIKDIQNHLGVTSDGIIGQQTIAAFGRFKRDRYLGGANLLGITTAKALAMHSAIVPSLASDVYFQKSLAFTLQWEGGYSNHPSDTGGATMKGITWRVYDQWRISQGLSSRPVKYITDQEVATIYRQRYWTPAGCDNLPLGLALAHFDWAVNAGVGRAMTTMKGAMLNVRTYNNKREYYYRRWGQSSQAVFLKGWLNRLAAVRRVSEF